MTPVLIVSFGYGHGPAPEAHTTIDVRHHFKDPHINPALRHLTAEDPDVIDAVMSTPGIPQLIDAAADTVRAFRSGPRHGPIVLAIGCAGGRHRAAVIAAMTADLLNSTGTPASLIHRDMRRPVIEHRSRNNRTAHTPATASGSYTDTERANHVNVRDIKVKGIGGERDGQSGAVSIWPIFDKQDWVNVEWEDGTITTAHPGEIIAPDEARQLARHAAVEARLRELADMSKRDLLTIVMQHARQRGASWAIGGPHLWSKDELINSTLAFEFSDTEITQ